ncbi:MAG: WD40 repeat domain-containing protein [Pirellulaceae bacterium]
MRIVNSAKAAFLLVLISGQAFAQSWSIDLWDIAIDDPTIDRVRSESLEFMPDGKTLVTAGFFYDGITQTAIGEVRLVSAKDGALRGVLSGGAQTYALRAGALARSPSGKWIAAGGLRGKIDLFDATAMKYVRTLQGEQAATSCLQFSPDGKILAAAHGGRTIELWNHENGKKTASFSSPTEVWSIAFSPDGALLATGNSEGSTTIRDAKSGEERGRIPAQEELGFLGCLAFSPDGKLLAAGGFPVVEGDSPIYVWRLQRASDGGGKVTAKREARFQGHREHTYSLAFSPDGKHLASANQDTTVRIWDVRTHRQFRPITAHTDFVYDVAFSPDGNSLATLGRESLKLWDFEQLRDAQ